MSVADADAIDDGVEEEIYGCLDAAKPRSFFLYAGAGSGKTRSLVNAINRVRRDSRRRLLLQGRRVAVITYTNAACDEIKQRLDFDPLVEVSTIHSFAWTLIGGYNSDIRAWLRINLAKEIDELEQASAKGRPSKAATDRARSIVAKRKRLTQIETVTRFVYSPSGDNRGRDSLSHSEVISLTSDFLTNKLVLQDVLVGRFPILFVDESQDTNKQLMEALLEVQRRHRARLCVGLFGDMMQRIYADGMVRLEEAIPSDWAKPVKRMNHRCPQRVIRLINHIRHDVDDQVQQGRTDKPEGLVRFFILPARATTDVEAILAQRMAAASGDVKWAAGLDGYKTLILEHHMAARRIGFDAMFTPLYKAKLLSTGAINGTLPGVRLFSHDVLPVVEAMRRDDHFAVARVIRERSSLLSQEALMAAAPDQVSQLTKAKSAVQSLMRLWDNSPPPTFQAVLNCIAEIKLFQLPDALALFAGQATTTADARTDAMLNEEADEELVAWRSFLDTQFDQISSYVDYVDGASPFGTHQGVKGLQFPRVMVVISDEEARGFMFSYEKLFGGKPKSETDLRNESAGQETTVDRTRRLLYVTCSRAEESLAIAAYSENPEAVRRQVIASGWFSEDEVEVLVP